MTVVKSNILIILRKLKTETLNFPIQATGSDILIEVWLETLKWPSDFGRIVFVVHDEFVVETNLQKFQEILKKVGKKYVPSVG